MKFSPTPDYTPKAVIRRLLMVLLAGVLGAATAGLVACGGGKQDKLLSPTEANELIASLEKIDSRFSDGDCEAAQGALASAEVDADSLSPEVDRELRRRISDGLERLRQLLSDECEVKTTTKTTTVPTVTETTPTHTQKTTTETTTTPTETQPPETEPPPETVPPADQGNTSGGGVETPPDEGGTPATP